MINLKKNLPYLAGLFTLVVIEIIISRPQIWWTASLVMLVVLLGIIFSRDWKNQISGTISGLILLIIPALAVLFFVEVILWQHLLALIIASLVAYYFIITNHLENKQQNNLIILPMTNIFFSSAMGLGLNVFFRMPIYYSLLIVSFLIALYPSEFKYFKNSKFPQASLPVLGLIKKKNIDLWFNQLSFTKNELSQNVFSRLGNNFWQLNLFKVILLLIMVEIFLVVSILPISIFTGASLVTIAVFCIFSLLNLKRMGILKKIFIWRYVGVSLLLIVLMLASAQWS